MHSVSYWEYLEGLSRQKDYKLILAFDEYEHLHDIFQSDREAAEKLLGALRSFSQHQNQVVFLFVGASFFSELTSPNWNEYFVQARDLRIDYLQKPDCIKLITRPVPDFGLIYPDDLVDRIFDLTRGHPTLVQQICSEMVNIANREMKRNMTHADLAEILETRVIDRENNTLNIFLTQFCKAAADRETVNQILAGQPPANKPRLLRLERHGYVVKDADSGNWKMRTPILDLWLRKFAETFE